MQHHYDSDIRARLETAMMAAIAANVPLSEVASGVGMSQSEFSRTFRRLFGESPVNYKRLRRVRIAQEMISTGEMSIKQVLGALGVRDRSHFSRAFKNIVGLTPSNWSRHIRKKCECPTNGSGARMGLTADQVVSGRFPEEGGEVRSEEEST